MFIIKDDNKYGNKPVYVTYVLMAVNIFVYFFFQFLPAQSEAPSSISGFFMMPEEIITGKDVVIPGYFEPSPYPVYLTLISSLFLHGDWLHLLGNMFYLFIFGDNLEAALGPLKFLFFYVLCGLMASGFDIGLTLLFDMNTHTLNLGASGAISGIIGGYMYLFPRNKLYFLFFFYSLLDSPAFIWGAFWIVTQLLGCILMFAGESGGVAYGAHLGGTLMGFFMIRLFFTKPDPAVVTPSTR